MGGSASPDDERTGYDPAGLRSLTPTGVRDDSSEAFSVDSRASDNFMAFTARLLFDCAQDEQSCANETWGLASAGLPERPNFDGSGAKEVCAQSQYH